MMDLIDNIESICRWRGLTLFNLAERIGISYLNLIGSIKGNPTITHLKRIAKALDVPVSELTCEEDQSPTLGFAIINGETYSLSRPPVSVVRIPLFVNCIDLRKAIESLLNKDTGNDMTSILGVFEGHLFALFYDTSIDAFYLTVCGEKKVCNVITYDCYEYSSWDDTKSDSTPIWDIEAVTNAIVDGILNGSCIC